MFVVCVDMSNLKVIRIGVIISFLKICSVLETNLALVWSVNWCKKRKPSIPRETILRAALLFLCTYNSVHSNIYSQCQCSCATKLEYSFNVSCMNASIAKSLKLLNCCKHWCTINCVCFLEKMAYIIPVI